MTLVPPFMTPHEASDQVLHSSGSLKPEQAGDFDGVMHVSHSAKQAPLAVSPMAPGAEHSVASVHCTGSDWRLHVTAVCTVMQLSQSTGQSLRAASPKLLCAKHNSGSIVPQCVGSKTPLHDVAAIFPLSTAVEALVDVTVAIVVFALTNWEVEGNAVVDVATEDNVDERFVTRVQVSHNTRQAVRAVSPTVPDAEHSAASSHCCGSGSPLHVMGIMLQLSQSTGQSLRAASANILSTRHNVGSNVLQ